MKATAFTLMSCLFVASVAVVFAQGPVVRVNPEQLKWTKDPANLGFEEAIVEGDPKKAGIYVIQVRFPPGVMSKPHYHRDTRYATVLKGTWYTGEGEVFAPEKTVGLKPGSFMKHPAGTRHYDGAKEEGVTLQLVGMGPSDTTKIKPNEGLFGPSLPGQQIKK